MNEQKKPGRQALRGGAYSLVVTAIVLAILIVFNIFVGALPATVTKYDISSSKLYSITSNTKVVVNALEQDVTIYWIVQSGQEDQVLENLLAKYESLSDHICVVKRNPDVYPTFAQQYTDETVQNNSLVVESGQRYRYIPLEDIYIGEMNMYTGSYSATDFDGEGAITSAIDYVVSEELPVLYLLQGHGEQDLPTVFSQQIEKENMGLETLSLLTADEVPEDASCVVIYAPSSDISQEEQEMLSDYVRSGGKLWVAAGPVEDASLDNLYALLSDYGVETLSGIVVEADRDHYAFQAPYILLPDKSGHSVTDSLIEENYYPIIPIAQGLSVGSTADGTVTALLTTSDTAFSKAAGYALDTYEKEEGDTDGPFALAVAVEDSSGGQIVWFASSNFLDELYNAYSSGANLDLGMNALSWLIGEREAIAIRSKSLNYNYLTISASTSSLLQTLMIGVFPLTYLAVGIGVVVRRRRLQNETD